MLDTDVPAIEAYPRRDPWPVHRVEYRQPPGRVAPPRSTPCAPFAGELFPQWQEQLAAVSGRPQRPLRWEAPWRTHELGAATTAARLIELSAIGEGWHVKRTPGGTSKFTKAGCCCDLYQLDRERPPGGPQCRAQIRRAEREARLAQAASAGMRPWLR